jgi:hypothetical protein
MSNNKKSSVEFILNNIHLKDSLKWPEIIEQAKAMHREEHEKTWDESMDNFIARGENYVRASVDFDDYYDETFNGSRLSINIICSMGAMFAPIFSALMYSGIKIENE